MHSPGPVGDPAIHCGARNTARRDVGAADHRTPIDRRNRDYLLAAPHPLTRREPTSVPALAEADLGILAASSASLGDGVPDHLRIPGKSLGV